MSQYPLNNHDVVRCVYVCETVRYVWAELVRALVVVWVASGSLMCGMMVTISVANGVTPN